MAANNSPRAFAVLGAGICGITLANVLFERYPDASVAIYADDEQNLVTYAAGAQFYPIWLGDHLPDGFDRKLRKWFLASKAHFIADSRSGRAINHARNYELFDTPVPPPSYFYDVLSNFRQEASTPLPTPYTYQYVFDTMIINPLLYMPRLRGRFLRHGGRIIKKRVSGLDDIAALPEPVVFNCIGFGSKAIFGDPFMSAVKGVSLRMRHVPALRYAVSAGEFIIAPRKGETYIGASYLPQVHTLEPTEGEQETLFENVKRIVEYPGTPFSLAPGTLQRKDIIEVRSGFRPLRSVGPRVEVEDALIGDKLVIHNYGHGGNGVILSWGTAEHAVELFEETLSFS